MKLILFLLLTSFVYGSEIQEKYISVFENKCNFSYGCKEVAVVSSLLDDKTLNYVLENKFIELYFSDITIESNSLKFSLFKIFIEGLQQKEDLMKIYSQNKEFIIINQKYKEKFESNLYGFYCSRDKEKEDYVNKRNFNLFYFVRHSLGDDYIGFVGTIGFSEKKEDIFKNLKTGDFNSFKESISLRNHNILNSFVSGFVLNDIIVNNLTNEEGEKLFNELTDSF